MALPSPDAFERKYNATVPAAKKAAVQKKRLGLEDIAKTLANPVIQGAAQGQDVSGGMATGKSVLNIGSGKGTFGDYLNVGSAALALASPLGGSVRRAINPTAAEAGASAINSLLKQKQLAVNMPLKNFESMMGMENPRVLTKLDNPNVGRFDMLSPESRAQIAESNFGSGSNPISAFVTTKKQKAIPDFGTTPQAAGTYIKNQIAMGANPNSRTTMDVGSYLGSGDGVSLYLKKNKFKDSTIFPGDTAAISGTDLNVPIRPGTKVTPDSAFVDAATKFNRTGNYLEANVLNGITPKDIRKIVSTNPEQTKAILQQAGIKIPVTQMKGTIRNPSKLESLRNTVAKKLQDNAARRKDLIEQEVLRRRAESFNNQPRAEG